MTDLLESDAPSYGIKKRVLGQVPFVPTDESAFLMAKASKEKLFQALAIEEKFDLLVRNYEDFEQEVFRVGLQGFLHFDGEWSTSRVTFYELVRRLVNLLMSCRLYIDQVMHHMSAIYGSGSGEVMAIRTACSREYDARLGYRVMEKLRNYVQHRGLPITGLTWSSNWITETDETRKHIRVTAVPILKVSDLADDGDFNRTVLDELQAIGEEHDIKPLLRDYLGGLGVVQAEVREAIGKDIVAWDAAIEDLIGSYEQAAGTDIVGLAAVRQVGRITTDHVPLFRDPIAYRKNLETRNSRTNFSNVVVTNY